MKCAAFLLALCALVCKGHAGCNRQFTPTDDVPDDCSTCTTPCCVYDHSIPSKDQLESPQPNTRTCYRTCHDAALGTCEASLTGVHNKNIRYAVSKPTYTLQILFSPNYNDNEDYRKSTICRYDVTCQEGMQLSYMFLGRHSLEERKKSCQNKCVDYIHLKFPASTDEVKVCGQEAPLNKLFADGHSAISVEFYANRHEEDVGFSMNVMCNVPGTSSRKRHVAESGETSNCARVSDVERAPVDSAQQLHEAFSYISHAHEDLQNIEQCQQFTIYELEAIYYESEELTIRRSYSEDMEYETLAEDVALLYVSNRFARSRTFNGGAPTPFQGYAELYVCPQTRQVPATVPINSSGDDLYGGRKHAYLLQTGVRQESMPTDDEEAVIVLLNQAITKYLECDNYFDVFDDLDAEEGFNHTNCISNFQRDYHLDGLALQYSNACNLFLRSAACSYRAVIMDEGCEDGNETDA